MSASTRAPSHTKPSAILAPPIAVRALTDGRLPRMGWFPLVTLRQVPVTNPDGWTPDGWTPDKTTALTTLLDSQPQAGE